MESAAEPAEALPSNGDDTGASGNAVASTSYEIRSLADSAGSEHTVESWAEFCAACFSEKDPPPPASHFHGHFLDDPLADITGIRVAIDLVTNEIIGTARVFDRSLLTGETINGNPVAARTAGIGEVCVAKTHRGKGLARALLADACTWAREQGYEWSLLHCRPQFIPLYRKCGYDSVETSWAWVPLSALKPYACGGQGHAEVESGVQLQDAALPPEEHVAQIVHWVYAEYSTSLGLAGPVKRSAAYMERWWPPMVRSLWLMRRSDSTDGAGDVAGNGESAGDMATSVELAELAEPECQAYACWKATPQGQLLAEFGATRAELARDGGLSALASLAIAACGAPENSDEAGNPGEVLIKVPCWVLKPFEETLALALAGSPRDTNYGWMYRSLNPEIECAIFSKMHAFWPTDSF